MTGLVGFIVWVIVSVIGGVGEAIDGTKDPYLLTALYASFVVMTLGPVLFWFVVPAAGFWGRRRRNRVSP